MSSTTEKIVSSSFSLSSIFDDRRQQTNRVMELLHRRLDYEWPFISLSSHQRSLARLRLDKKRAGILCVCASLSRTLFFLYPT
jgi:hypothetical protein